eukprot:COSAG06_NODE_1971_length_7939_cov_87.132908_6_plen_77_part_00
MDGDGDIFRPAGLGGDGWWDELRRCEGAVYLTILTSMNSTCISLLIGYSLVDRGVCRCPGLGRRCPMLPSGRPRSR